MKKVKVFGKSGYMSDIKDVVKMYDDWVNESQNIEILEIIPNLASLSSAGSTGILQYTLTIIYIERV